MIENQLANSRIVIPVGPGKIYDVDVQDLLQVTCDTSRVIFLVSCVTRHMSHVTRHVSHITPHTSLPHPPQVQFSSLWTSIGCCIIVLLSAVEIALAYALAASSLVSSSSFASYPSYSDRVQQGRQFARRGV